MWSRRVVSVLAFVATVSICAIRSTEGRSLDEKPSKVIALDQFAADWLKPRLANVSIVVLFENSEESHDAMTRRAWSMRNATHLVYHSDRLNLMSQIFCERLQSQGVQLVDLKEFDATLLRNCSRSTDTRMTLLNRRLRDSNLPLLTALVMDRTGKGAGQ